MKPETPERVARHDLIGSDDRWTLEPIPYALRNLFHDLDPVWRALAEPTRRAILDALRDGPRTTGDISARFDVSRFAVMKHLRALERARLVVVRRRGRERWNYLNPYPSRGSTNAG